MGLAISTKMKSCELAEPWTWTLKIWAHALPSVNLMTFNPKGEQRHCLPCLLGTWWGPANVTVTYKQKNYINEGAIII